MSNDPLYLFLFDLPVTLQSAARAALKVLLEERHLYQSVTIEYPKGPPGDVNAYAHYAAKARGMVNGRWTAVDPLDRQLVSAAATQPHAYFYLTPPDVKLFCTKCHRIEAFNAVSAEDITGRGRADTLAPYSVARQTMQVFAFSYLCQSCKEAPEVFLVRRHGLKLTNVGRSPMEHTAVPPDVPKSVARFFSGAVIAHQSGQTLAGLFMLRTLLEQFARATTASQATNADEVMEAYMLMLPQDLKSRFDSMRDLYGRLSVDLHGAIGSAELFEEAKDKIAKHFEIRRVFHLT